MIGYGTDYPNPDAEGGAELLDDVHAFLGGFVAFPSSHAVTAVTLWAAHTHLVNGFESTPRLVLQSPEPQCGKTRVLELLELLCVGAETLSDASPAYLFRRIGAAHHDDPQPVTILIDEADAIWKRKSDESAEALRSIVNAGHRRGATVGRVVMMGQTAKPVQFPTYGPAALASKGDHLPDTIVDRAVKIHMRRRAPDEYVREFRQRSTRPEGEALRDRLADWAATVADQVGCLDCSWPDMPAGVADRPADVWEPLLKIADLAGGGWPQRARAACVAFVAGAQEDPASLGLRLLTDLQVVFDGHDVMPTETILGKLHVLDESPWGDWYGKPLAARDLAKMLKPYGVKPKVVRVGATTPRGYTREDLHDPWARYVVGVSATSATSATPLASTVADVADVADTGTTGCPDCGWPLDSRDHLAYCEGSP